MIRPFNCDGLHVRKFVLAAPSLLATFVLLGMAADAQARDGDDEDSPAAGLHQLKSAEEKLERLSEHEKIILLPVSE